MIVGANPLLLKSAGFPQKDALISFYNFDENSGVSTSDEINSNDGTLTSSGLWSAGLIGSALKGDGSNYVQLGSANNLYGLTNAVTVGFAHYCTSTASAFVALDAGVVLSATASLNEGMLWFYSAAAGEYQFRVRQSVSTGYNGGIQGRWNTGLAPQEDEWNIILMARDSGNAKIWMFNSLGLTEASISGSYGTLSNWSNKQNYILASDTDKSGTVNAISGNLEALDLLAVWDVFLTDQDAAAFANNLEGVKP